MLGTDAVGDPAGHLMGQLGVDAEQHEGGVALLRPGHLHPADVDRCLTEDAADLPDDPRTVGIGEDGEVVAQGHFEVSR